MLVNKHKYLALFLIILLSGCSFIKDWRAESAWRKQHKDIFNYFDKTTTILEAGGKVVADYANKYERIDTISKISFEAKAELFRLQKKLVVLPYPRDLSDYRKEIMKGMDYLVDFINVASIQGNIDPIVSRYHETLIGATKELNRVFIEYNAPQGFLDNQEELIREFTENRKSWDTRFDSP